MIKKNTCILYNSPLKKKKEEEENSVRHETRNHEKEILIRDYKTVYPSAYDPG